MYRIVFSNDAKKDLKELSKKAPLAVKNCQSFWKKSRSIPGLVPIVANSLQLGFYNLSPENYNKSIQKLMYNRRYTPERISELKENEIFVFGSNLAGAHGGGAAWLAFKQFGAVWGEGVGMYGQTYAIPTMQGGVETIKPYVDDFIRFAKEHPGLTFLVTRIGCGIAGFRDEQIAPLFADAINVENIILPMSFVKCLEH